MRTSRRPVVSRTAPGLNMHLSLTELPRLWRAFRSRAPLRRWLSHFRWRGQGVDPESSVDSVCTARGITTGQRAEAVAAAYLREHGLYLLDRNYRCKLGEIDLVMREGELLVFVEVRYRSSGRFGHAVQTVDLNKQRKLTRAARMFLLTNQIPATTRCRFDVVGINAVADDIDWVRDAFDAM